jgi:hypothetical protein
MQEMKYAGAMWPENVEQQKSARDFKRTPPNLLNRAGQYLQFYLDSALDHSIFPGNQCKVGHVQKQSMFHHSYNRVDLAREFTRVFD